MTSDGVITGLEGKEETPADDGKAAPRGRNRDTGIGGESLAAGYLMSKGLRILARNYRVVQGELDIVAMDGQVLVFCEVKTRRGIGFGPPECAVTPWKQRQMRRAAEAYLYCHGLRDQECRFDVVAVLLHDGTHDITHFKNAFYF